MAPKRPAQAELIFEDGYDPAGVTGVLVTRAEGSAALEMARRSLEVDAGWAHEEAVAAIASARIEAGRWWKTPNRHADGWVLVGAGTRPASGATPGVLFRIAKR